MSLHQVETPQKKTVTDVQESCCESETLLWTQLLKSPVTNRRVEEQAQQQQI